MPEGELPVIIILHS